MISKTKSVLTVLFKSPLSLCLLFGLSFLSTQLDQYISNQMDLALKRPEGLSNEIWIWAIASFLSSFLIPPLWTLIFLFKFYFNLSAKEAWIRFKTVINQAYIETMRSWGKIFQWSFALIIPGIIRWFQYSLVLLVVALDNNYQNGQEDALEFSRTLFRKKAGKLSLLIIGGWIIYPLISSMLFDDYRSLSEHPVGTLVSCFLDFFVSCVTTYWFVRIFIHITKEVGHELTIPMERY